MADAIGVKLTSRTLVSYGNAQRLFNYTQLAMPYQAPRTLTERDYWDVVAYLVNRFTLVADSVMVNGNTAESLTFWIPTLNED